MHISTSFFESKRELHSSYHCPIPLPLHFGLLSLIRPARLTIQVHSAEGEEIEQRFRCFYQKMTSISFSIRAPLTVAAVFPDLPFPGGMQVVII